MDKHIERAAAAALLDRGTAFRIPAPRVLKLFGKKKVRIVVRRLRLGTLLHIADLRTVEAPVPDNVKNVVEEMTGGKAITFDLQELRDNLPEVCRMVAACLLNSETKIALFKKPLGRYLRRHLTADQMQELVMWIFAYSRAESFTNTIKLIGAMNVTSPMSLSPEIKRS